MLEWDLLSMKLRAAFIRNAVARGIYNVDDIRLDYNIFKGGGDTRKQVFLNTLELALSKNKRYNTPEWRKFLTELALRESSFRPDVTNKIGAKGYFQLMPENRTSTWNSPTLQFELMFALTDSNLNYFKKNMTESDLIKAQQQGVTIYDLARAAHLGGAKNALKALRGQSNAKDINGTSVLDYMRGSSRDRSDLLRQGFIPILDNTGVNLLQQPTVTAEEILLNVTIPEPIKPDDDIQATAEIPEVEVIGHQPQVNPLTILSLIQESAPDPFVLEPYLIPLILNKVNEIATERNSFLQKDLEDRILAGERRKRLGYSYRDENILNDIELIQFLGNMSANGGSLSDSDYYTIMERVAEENNSKWNELRAKEGAPPLSVEEEYLRILNDSTYDYRGYYNKYPQSKANVDTHWTDEFKTAFHPKFSIESKYSGLKSQYNPNGYIGGVWLKNGQFVPTFWQLNMFGGGGLMPIINVPAVAKNLYNKAKDRLYRTITPQGYHLGRAAKEFIKGDTRDFTKFTPAENEVWARYLGVPYEGESNFEKAIYTPTKGGATYDDVIKFKDESQILSDDVLRQLLQNQMLTGKNTMLVEGNESGLGTYTLSLGEDENGKYISYYDDWDINPTRGLSAKYKIPLIEQIGDIVPGSNPFTVYGRRYYTDEDLRRIIER